MATFGTFTAGQVLTAAELNGAGTWTDYSPSWTQSATITKTVNFARYCQFNKLIFVSLKMTATSAGTSNNKILVGLPVSASSNNFIMGTSIWNDVSDASFGHFFTYSKPALYETSTTVAFGFGRFTSSSLGGGTTNVRFGQTYDSTTFTIASGDEIYVQLAYEAA
jgi:hypothetical protein